MELAKSRFLSPEWCISLCVMKVPVRTSSPVVATSVGSKATGVAAASLTAAALQPHYAPGHLFYVTYVLVHFWTLMQIK